MLYKEGKYRHISIFSGTSQIIYKFNYGQEQKHWYPHSRSMYKTVFCPMSQYTQRYNAIYLLLKNTIAWKSVFCGKFNTFIIPSSPRNVAKIMIYFVCIFSTDYSIAYVYFVMRVIYIHELVVDFNSFLGNNMYSNRNTKYSAPKYVILFCLWL